MLWVLGFIRIRKEGGASSACGFGPQWNTRLCWVCSSAQEISRRSYGSGQLFPGSIRYMSQGHCIRIFNLRAWTRSRRPESASVFSLQNGISFCNQPQSLRCLRISEKERETASEYMIVLTTAAGAQESTFVALTSGSTWGARRRPTTLFSPAADAVCATWSKLLLLRLGIMLRV